MIRPIGDLVLLQPDGEIPLNTTLWTPPERADTHKLGRIAAVGPGRLSKIDGHRLPMHVKAGDAVIYSIHAVEQYRYNGQRWLGLHETDIVSIIED